MAKKRKKELHQFVVPMRWGHRGHAVVEAFDAEEAVAKCEKFECELEENAAELINWEVTGDPEISD